MSIDDRRPARTDRTPGSRRTVRTVLLVLLAVVLVVALVVGLYLWSLGRAFDTGREVLEQPFPAESARPSAGSGADEGTTVLVMGEDHQGGAGERADAIMLLHVPEDGGAVYVMSIPRDLWVEIPGVGQAKINSAIDAGGVPLMVDTVEGLFDTRVDQVAQVDFEGFENIVDAVGGVTIDVPKDFVSWQKDMLFTAGPMHMDGATALEFVRERRSFEMGDLKRVENQRLFLEAVLDKLISKDVLSDPGRIRQMVSELAPHLEVSEGLDAGWVAGLAPELAGVGARDVDSFTVPHEGIGTSPDGQSIVVSDTQAMEDIGVAISEDKLDEYLATLNSDE
ncbi:LCP family protein [Kocuria sp. M1R5S2]|uniref:LCP family protein n=1 Tax=Kocuria rhizosphaerae TaxID=3376285 RepID=UPI0037874DF0